MSNKRSNKNSKSSGFEWLRGIWWHTLRRDFGMTWHEWTYPKGHDPTNKGCPIGKCSSLLGCTNWCNGKFIRRSGVWNHHLSMNKFIDNGELDYQLVINCIKLWGDVNANKKDIHCLIVTLSNEPLSKCIKFAWKFLLDIATLRRKHHPFGRYWGQCEARAPPPAGSALPYANHGAGISTYKTGSVG